MDVGRVIEFIEGKRIMCGVCLGVKTGKIRVLTEANREISLPPSRIVHQSTHRLSNLPRNDVLRSIREIAKKREMLKEKVSPSELWDLLYKEGMSFDAQSIAGLSFDDSISSDHVSAVIRSLFEDKIYFKLKGNSFLPNPPQVVEQIMLQIKRNDAKEKDLNTGSKWFSAIWEGRAIEEPENREEYINLLKELAILGKESSSYERGKEMLSRAGLNGENVALDLLVKMGVFSPHENLLLHYYKVPIHFPAKVVEEADEVCRRNISAELGADLERKDLRTLPAITIDRRGTRDRDDALSIERNGDRCHVGIHITDVSYYIPLNSIIDQEAQIRATSIYLPDARIPMIPENLSEHLLSLKEGKDQPALSILVELDSSYNMVSYEVYPSIINIRRQLNYKQVEEMVSYDPDIHLFYSVSQSLHRKRMSQGALPLPIPEIHIYVDDTHQQIRIEKIDPESKARQIVSEFMILATWLCARFLKEKGIPSIYRSQEEPHETILDEETSSLYLNYKQRRLLGRTRLGTEPRPHSTLGMDVYTAITSPIRRYLDLIVQRQMIHALEGKCCPYTKEALNHIAIMLEGAYKKANLLKQNRVRYWLLKYLEQKLGEETQAVVLERLPRKYRLLLTEYLLEVHIPLEKGLDLAPGDTISVHIIRVNVREDVIKVAVPLMGNVTGH